MKKIVIIGAGPAGLTAADLLAKNKEYNVVVLEEASIVGGISKTINYKENRMDIGGHRFFSKEEKVVEYWKSILTFDNNLSDNTKKDIPDDIMLKRKRVSRIYYDNTFFDYPVTLSLNTIKGMGPIRLIAVVFSYIKAVIFKRKENSLEDFYINRFGKKLYSMFFEKYTEKLWGRHPSVISPNWGKQRVKGISILELVKNLFKGKGKERETSLIEEFYYPKYGPGQLYEKIAENIEKNGGKIYKNCKVTKLINNAKNISKVIYEENGVEKTIDADIVISSMPIKDLVNALNTNNKKINEIANNLPYRDFITVGVLAKKLKLKGNIEDCWIYIQDPNVMLGRLQIFNNWSPYLVKDNENTVWIGLEYFVAENDKYWNMSEEEFTNFAISELVKMNVIDKEDIIDTHEEKVKKAYPAYFDSYDEFSKVKEFLDKYSNLYCIGRNGQHRYNNMDHSILTGMYAAENIISGIKSKENIWNVNTEEKYHEEK